MVLLLLSHSLTQLHSSAVSLALQVPSPPTTTPPSYILSSICLFSPNLLLVFVRLCLQFNTTQSMLHNININNNPSRGASSSVQTLCACVWSNVLSWSTWATRRYSFVYIREHLSRAVSWAAPPCSEIQREPVHVWSNLQRTICLALLHLPGGSMKLIRSVVFSAVLLLIIQSVGIFSSPTHNKRTTKPTPYSPVP